MELVSRRKFLRQATLATTALAFAPLSHTFAGAGSEPLFKISLAQWSLNPLLFSGKMDNLDFAKDSKKHGIDAVEYVNQFFMDKATDKAYLKEMKTRADGEGVRSLLIMCDREGNLGDPDEKLQMECVENHKKWVEAANFLGCHSIRVNGYSKGSKKEQKKLVAAGLHKLCAFADAFDINVIIENHGGFSSDGKWLAGVMKAADHPRAGSLPDFGNFRISEEASYDSYLGVEELMPYAKGVSVKPTVFDDAGNQSELDYERMMKIVIDAGYHGYCGIEHGPKGSEWEGILKVKGKLEAAREKLAG